VPALGHREGAGDLEAHRRRQELLVVTLGAEVKDGGGEEPPLHARLDLQRRIGEHEFLEGGDVAARVVTASEARREGAVHRILLHEQVQLTEHPGTVLGEREVALEPELRSRGERARGLAVVGPAAEQVLAEPLGVDGEGSGCGGRVARRAHLVGQFGSVVRRGGSGGGFGARHGVLLSGVEGMTSR